MEAQLSRVRDAWDAWQRDFACSVAPRTRQLYATLLRHALDELPPVVTLPVLVTWRAQLAQRYGAAHVNQHLSALRAVTTRAALVTRDDDLARLARLVTPLPAPAPAPRCPTVEQYRAALATSPTPAHRLWLRLAALGGLRRGELEGLRPADWDEPLRALHVRRQRHSPTLKGGRAHTLRVEDAPTLGDLRWTLAHRGELGSPFGLPGPELAGWLFPWGRKFLELWLARLHVELGWPRGWGWHCLRHLGATTLARQGASTLDLQSWLHHKEPAMATVYIADVRGETAATTAVVAAALEGRRPCKRVDRRRDEQHRRRA